MNKKNNLKSLLGQIPSGYFVVITKSFDKKRVNWFMASWIQQASFNPPMVSLCLKPQRPGVDEITEKEYFTINVLDKDLSSYFEKNCNGNKIDLLEDLETIDLGEKGIVLKNAKSYMVCKAQTISMPGDHYVVVCEVLDGLMLNKEKEPSVHIRDSGAHY
jgi:flavin reductase (DIM6/NTAB) family NADH-FMN oxidoreductase RutF